ncbi:hypothetical protein CES85_4726 [Ochrobactrum quorumnocens]|uniref:Uncharacterized protein n=1 Tax=Ochrobactrum quorumnocens TaxID=271865 RepID=A0A248UAX6_9HYPH|nr:hypothetical protein [[Ochrobactrum] quorumnocens]ASV83943.1 hypothetical protein CES85_4726 [[Ochrobactrum] quorumnocens]
MSTIVNFSQRRARHDRIEADLLVIDYFRQKYGIWQKGGEIDRETNLRTTSMYEILRRRKLKLVESNKAD